jgi:hypothetical protein
MFDSILLFMVVRPMERLAARLLAYAAEQEG